MPSEEKLLTIPLRREWLKKPRVHRTQRSVIEIKSYLFKHMKATDVKMSELLNESLWKGGSKIPLNKVKLKASKDEKGVVTLMLPEEKIVVEEKKGVAAKILRRKGKIVKKIVLDKPKEKTEVETAKTEAPKVGEQKPVEHQHKPGEEHKHAETPATKPAEAPKPVEEKSKEKK